MVRCMGFRGSRPILASRSTLAICVVLGNLFYLSQTQFLYPENGDKNTYLLRL